MIQRSTRASIEAYREVRKQASKICKKKKREIIQLCMKKIGNK